MSTVCSFDYILFYRTVFCHQVAVYIHLSSYGVAKEAGLAQSVERQALNLMVEGSSPSFGVLFSCSGIFLLVTVSCLYCSQEFCFFKLIVDSIL
jgi:hypothetical protein